LEAGDQKLFGRFSLRGDFMELVLPAKPPFSYLAVAQSHGWAQLEPFIWAPETHRLAYFLRLCNGHVVRLDFGPTEGGLLVRFNQDLDEEEMRQVAGTAEWMFGLGLDLSPFYEHARREPKLAHVIPEARGRVLRSPTVFEDVIKTILTTNVQWGGTIRMVRELVQAYGEPWPADEAWHAFPTPQRLAQESLEDFTARVRLGYRAPYILELARKVASGELDLESLKSSDLPTSELRKELLAIKGVGGYAAANLLMILGRFDAIPIDSWAHKMVSNEFYHGEPVTPAQIEEVFAPWGEYKGLAYWFWDWSEI
jgi:3-methyladenine DNA glycosylase/8-oxoguanine DNA glycosylase